jgi:hypothetical protein
MTTFLQFLAVTVLGLVSAWLVKSYFGLLGNTWPSFALLAALCWLYGFIYDRHQKRKRLPDMPGSQELE